MNAPAIAPILVIDDDSAFNAILVRTLERRGHPACGALNGDDGLRMAAERACERIVLDLNLDGSSGLALIPELLAINPDCRIVVLTGYASIATAVEAVKRGATQYLAKPVEIEAILAGEARFRTQAAWAELFARNAAAILGRELIRVDVEHYVIGY